MCDFFKIHITAKIPWVVGRFKRHERLMSHLSFSCVRCIRSTISMCKNCKRKTEASTTITPSCAKCFLSCSVHVSPELFRPNPLVKANIFLLTGLPLDLPYRARLATLPVCYEKQNKKPLPWTKKACTKMCLGYSEKLHFPSTTARWTNPFWRLFGPRASDTSAKSRVALWRDCLRPWRHRLVRWVYCCIQTTLGQL